MEEKKINKELKIHYLKVIKKIRLSSDYLIFYSFFCNLALRRIMPYYFKKYFLNGKSGSLLYFCFISSIAILVFIFLDIEKSKTNIFTYFTASGAMIGGILAIIFSLNTFLMQNAAENSSAGFYKTLGKDKIQDGIYFYITFATFLLFSCAFITEKNILYFNNQSYLSLKIAFACSLFLIGSVLFLVYVLYKRVFKRIQPFTAISIIENEAFKELDNISSLAKDGANLMFLNPRRKEKIDKSTILASSYLNLLPQLAYLNDRLAYLFDYHDKLLAKQEKNLALLVLNSLTRILKKYFDIKKDCSVIYPSGFFATTSDSHGFLTPNLEKFVSIGKSYIRADDNVGITHVIRLFADLAKASTEIKYIGDQHDNPIFTQCRGYLDQLVNSVISLNNFEGLFQAASEYGRLGFISIKKEMRYELPSIYSGLDKLAYHTLVQKQEIPLNEVINSFNLLLESLIEERDLGIEQEIEELLEHLQQILLTLFKMLQGGYFKDATIFCSPFQLLQKQIFNLVTKVKAAQTEEEKKKNKSKFMYCIEELRSTLRYLSDNMKNADHLIMRTFGELIGNIGILLLSLSDEQEWKDEKEELVKKTGWYLHQARWFITEADKIDNNLNFAALIEAMCKIGLEALSIGESQLATEAVEEISKTATEMFNKEKGNKYGFTEPRIMLLACYIGILALKKGDKTLFDIVKNKIDSFEKLYTQKYFITLPKKGYLTSPNPKQLQIEIFELINKLRNPRSIDSLIDRCADRLVRIANEDDINNFTSIVWGTKYER